MKRMMITGGIVLALYSAGCGDDGSDIDPNAASGQWRGVLELVQSSCVSFEPSQTLEFAHEVMHNGEQVTLTDANGILYQGGFSTNSMFTASGQLQADESCTDDRTFTYRDIDSDSDDTANVEYNLQSTCDNGSTCTAVYGGLASRVAGGGEQPQTPPTEGTDDGEDPAQEGCKGITERTASGTYTGDGGCGISEVRFSHLDETSPERVELDPFGANGLTTFEVDSADPTMAVSTNTNLTILGAAGHTCRLDCTAPSTFTARCTTEAGSSCSEKF